MNIPKNIPKPRSTKKDESSILLKQWEEIWEQIHPKIKIYRKDTQIFNSLLDRVYESISDGYPELVRILLCENKYYCFLENDIAYAVDDLYTPDEDYYINNRLQSLQEEYTWAIIQNRIIQDIENTYPKIPTPQNIKASS